MAKNSTKTTNKKPASASTGRALAVAGDPAGVAAVQSAPMPDGFKVKRALTMPLFKFGPAATVYVKFVGPIFKSKPLTNAKGEESKKEPPHLAEIVRVDDDSGVVYHMIVPAVLKSELEGGYKDNGYVGKLFGIKSFPPRPKVIDETTGEVIDAGKSYRTFSIVELEAA